MSKYSFYWGLLGIYWALLILGKLGIEVSITSTENTMLICAAAICWTIAKCSKD